MQEYYDNDRKFTRYIVRINDQCGIIDTNGKILIECLYEDLRRSRQSNTIYTIKYKGKYGIISEDAVILAPYYERIDFLNNESFAIVGNGGKYAIFNISTGKFITPYKYQDAKCNRFSDNIFVKLDGMWGLINQFGKVYLHCTYEEIEPHEDNNWECIGYSVKKGGMYGYVSKYEETLIPCKFEQIKPYENEGAIIAYIVKSGNAYGAIDPQGYIIVDCKYDHISFTPYVHEDNIIYGYKIVVEPISTFKYGCGFISPSAQMMVPCEYIETTPCIYQGKIVAFIVKDKNCKKGAISLEQECIVDFLYFDVDFVCTKKNCFICYHDGSNYMKWDCDARCKALFLAKKEVIQLECEKTYKCGKELEEMGY